jgi:hypothetical protein
VRRAAGFHPYAGRLLGKDAEEGIAGQAVSLGDLAWIVGPGDLEHGLGRVDRDHRMFHPGLLLPHGVS